MSFLVEDPSSIAFASVRYIMNIKAATPMINAKTLNLAYFIQFNSFSYSYKSFLLSIMKYFWLVKISTRLYWVFE
jgi:hypothetical protein